MKIKRFVAADMRQAMREVREEQGPDAVILSTRRLDDGIEIIAAVDYDEALVREAARHGTVPAPREPATASEPPPIPLPPRASLAERVAAAVAPAEPAEPAAVRPAPALAPAPAPAQARPRPAAPPASAPARAVAAEEAAAPAAAELPALHPLVERTAQDTVRMRNELNSLREMLEVQLSSLAWNDLERRQPLHARVLRELTRLGVEADIARALAAELPAQLTAEQARYLPLGMLSRGLVIGNRHRGDRPGVTALVGPTGVGKTTTLAKLAARAVVRLGASQVALVSTDHYRIGAAAQLEHYGRLLGVRVYPAYDAQSLRQVLGLLKDCHTVLVDTAGVAGSDPRLQEQMDALADAGDVRATLVLAANAQAQSLEDSIRAYAPLQPQGVILTKLDEAPCMGGALSVLIRHRLPLDYTTDGQRVPEDIAVADARVLVCRAAQATKNNNFPAADEVLLADRFGVAGVQA